jgi:nucleoside-diphosphate-sugar epimerase
MAGPFSNITFNLTKSRGTGSAPAIEPGEHFLNSSRPSALVLGGCGYIGQIVCERLLEAGFAVAALDSFIHGSVPYPQLTGNDLFLLMRADMNSPPLMGLASVMGFDHVVVLGGLVGEAACDADPPLALLTNHLSPLLLLDACLYHEKVKRFVFVSTDSCYGQRPGELLTEESELRPLTLYASLKALTEEKVLARTQGEQMAGTIVRFATAYGLSPRMRFDLALNVLTRGAVLKKKAKIHSGEQWRPFIHVRDAAEAIHLVLTLPIEKVRGQIINAGSNEQNIQFSELGKIIGECVPDAKIKTVPGDPDLRDYHVSFDKIKALGFTPKHTIKDGVAEIRDALRAGKIREPFSQMWRNS